jgi:hypothetical protein
MPRAKRKASGTAKPAGEQIIRKRRGSPRWFAPVLTELRELFPPRSASLVKELAFRADRSIRIVEDWVAGRGAPDGAALTALIKSDVGDRVMLALTRDCHQPWIKSLRRTHELASLRKAQDETGRRIAALERGLAE